ncbi:topoisomerase DNA-binding C4 zinc finger domain-containing protein [Vibrio sp. 10N.261.46.E12]|uniref:topoisomerase DNA-binding C4 zinc finger domain-containing protein n=1 Tax=unclassified Vibrio TaxID=2614977 RepID=UPI0009772364
MFLNISLDLERCLCLCRVEIYRVPVSNTYSPVTLSKELSELGISIKESLQAHTETDDDKATSIFPPESACPKCGSALQVKHSEKNQSDFIGCSSFPKCRYTQAI